MSEVDNLNSVLVFKAYSSTQLCYFQKRKNIHLCHAYLPTEPDSKDLTIILKKWTEQSLNAKSHLHPTGDGQATMSVS
jgi:hypothetical protein